MRIVVMIDQAVHFSFRISAEHELAKETAKYGFKSSTQQRSSIVSFRKFNKHS
jgi:hypothetical protein